MSVIFKLKKWFQLKHKPQCWVPMLQCHDLLRCWKGSMFYVAGQHHWALSRDFWRISVPFCWWQWHITLACPVSMETNLAGVWFVLHHGRCFPWHPIYTVHLQDIEIRQTVLWFLTHLSNPLPLTGAPDWEWSVNPAQGETSKYHHAGWGDGNSYWALSGDGIGQSKRMERFQEISLVPNPKTSHILEGPNWKNILLPWNVRYLSSFSMALMSFFHLLQARLMNLLCYLHRIVTIDIFAMFFFMCPLGRRSLWCNYLFNQVHWERWQCDGVQPGQRPQVSSWPQHCAQRHQAREPLGMSSLLFFVPVHAPLPLKWTDLMQTVSFQSLYQSCNKGLREFKLRVWAWLKLMTIKY